MEDIRGPLSEYIEKAFKQCGYLILQSSFSEDDVDNVDFYYLHLVKPYVTVIGEYIFALYEHKNKRLAKDRHQAALQLLCRFDYKDESDEFLDEIKKIGILEDDILQGNATNNFE